MYVHVKVTAKSKKEAIKEEKPGYFKIDVKEKAERNLANTRVRELMAMHFGFPVKAVRIISGIHEKTKLISLPDTEKSQI